MRVEAEVFRDADEGDLCAPLLANRQLADTTASTTDEVLLQGVGRRMRQALADDPPMDVGYADRADHLPSLLRSALLGYSCQTGTSSGSGNGLRHLPTRQSVQEVLVVKLEKRRLAPGDRLDVLEAHAEPVLRLAGLRATEIPLHVRDGERGIASAPVGW